MRFVFAAWLLTRALLVVVFFLASAHPLTSMGNWDGAWYGSIAMHGYGFAANGPRRDAAFFPFFPLLALGLMRMGISWPLAGIAISNLAFLGSLIAMHAIVRVRTDRAAARWVIATACACPLSLFASVAYPESCYLLFSGIALYAMVRHRLLLCAISAASATATGALGISLAGALVVQTAIDRRGVRALALTATSLLGILAFVLFCAWRFGDPFAFVHAQHAWRSSFGVDWRAWQRIALSLRSWNGFRANVMVVALVPLGALAIFAQRKQLGTLLTLYGLAAIALILFAGTPISADRKAYTIVPVLVAIGLSLRRVPALGVGAIAASLTLLAYDAAEFARFQWVA